MESPKSNYAVILLTLNFITKLFIYGALVVYEYTHNEAELLGHNYKLQTPGHRRYLN